MEHLIIRRVAERRWKVIRTTAPPARLLKKVKSAVFTAFYEDLIGYVAKSDDSDSGYGAIKVKWTDEGPTLGAVLGEFDMPLEAAGALLTWAQERTEENPS